MYPEWTRGSEILSSSTKQQLGSNASMNWAIEHTVAPPAYFTAQSSFKSNDRASSVRTVLPSMIPAGNIPGLVNSSYAMYNSLRGHYRELPAFLLPDVGGDVSKILVPKVYDMVRIARNSKVAERALSILQELEKTLLGVNTKNLPALHVVESDDGSISFEWVKKGRRAGIAVESDLNDSSWFLLADDSNGKVQKWGYLENIDFTEIVSHMQQG